MIKNRLEKNLKKLKPWANRIGTEAFRLYDRDIPEFPFILDVYRDKLLAYDKSEDIDQDKNHWPLFIQAVAEVFQQHPDQIYKKIRSRQKGESQYTKLSSTEEFFAIQERPAYFRVNLSDYLDTGLFLDHRPMRYKIYKTAKDKRVLNLFSYTGSVSVMAALGGGRVTSVDMSSTYIDWAKENFKINKIPLQEHHFVVENALEWLEATTEKFDLIFLDPPTFSNSKKMTGTFDVERDQDDLVISTMKLLTPNGILYFSNNKRKFKLSAHLQERFAVKDITEESIPEDFHDKKIHVCFAIRHKS